ncbi:MAG: phosphatidylinositol kinase [Acidobacteria bacterium]|nr:phosphatidylinositol kinase [Acidobacteriota bacterium]MCH8947893.1 phosphatidylinositol kinase [Acidobacteriota bacterium]
MGERNLRRALQHVRRMRGGAQAHLLRCDDQAFYVTKFQNNPQHLRVLANELLAALLADALGLPVARPEVVEVSPELIDNTSELRIQKAGRWQKCLPGFQFGSRFPGQPNSVLVHDLLPDEHLSEVENLAAFAGMLLFDQWTCNTNGRQVIFIAEPHQRSGYRALMIDQGFCFNAGEWNFPDSPLRGLYHRQRVYAQVRGWRSFEPYLSRLEALPPSVLDQAAAAVPPEWYNADTQTMTRLLEQLDRRRARIRELIAAVKNSSRQPFPHWS